MLSPARCFGGFRAEDDSVERERSGHGVAGRAWPFFAGAALIMVAHGLQGTLIPLRAALEGFPTAATGAVMSGYFVGMLAGSVLSPALVRQVGQVRVFAALASLASVSVLMHALFVEVVFWTSMRVVTGFCYSGMYVVVESWLNQQATNRNRGRLLSLYMVTMFAGAAAGQLLLNAADPGEFDLFLVVSILVSLALVPLLLAARPGPRPRRSQRLTVAELYRASPLGVVAAVLTGVIHGALFGLGAIYAREIGLEVAEVAWFMALAMIGALCSQWPLGWLSDRFDRRRAMLGAALVGGAAPALVAAGPAEPAGTVAFAMMFVLGAAALPLYSLCISQVNDYLSPWQMVGASGTLVFVTGCGLIAGPLIAALALETLGPPGFLFCLAVVHVVLAGFIVFRMGRRAAKPVEEQAGYVPAGTRSSPVLIELAAAEGRELAGSAESAASTDSGPGPDPEAEAGVRLGG